VEEEGPRFFKDLAIHSEPGELPLNPSSVTGWGQNLEQVGPRGTLIQTMATTMAKEEEIYFKKIVFTSK
jgi:hypothetical protein